MQNSKKSTSKNYYLDISEYIMKDCSPILKPKSQNHPIEVIIIFLLLRHSFHLNAFLIHQQLIQSPQSPQDIVPEISPLIQARIHFPMTPIFDRSKSDPLGEASYDDFEGFSLCGNTLNNPKKKLKRERPRLPSMYHIVDNELENIIEDKEAEDYIEQSNSSLYMSDNEELDKQVDQESSFSNSDQIQGDKQSATNFQFSNYEFKSPQWQTVNPKKQLVTKIKVIVSEAQSNGLEQKFSKIKEAIVKYLCQYELFYFEQSMETIKKTHSEINQAVEIVLKGIDQTFKKVIGGLSFEKRRIKLLRYLDKKKRRVWKKKVNYDCRKKVADGRLRIKGKFVTYDQACEQLGFNNLDGYSPDQIKQMLVMKIEHS